MRTISKPCVERLDARQLLSGVVDTSRPFYFQTGDVDAILTYLNGNQAIVQALDADVLPYVNDSTLYEPGSNTDNGPLINGKPQADRGAVWFDLAVLFRYTQKYGTGHGSTKAASAYSGELINEVNEFSAAYDTVAERTSATTGWSVLDTGARAENWSQAYYVMYDPTDLSTWNTSVRNTFNASLSLQGDFLYDRASPTGANVPNQRLTGYAGLYVLAMSSTYTGVDWDGNGASNATQWLDKTATASSSAVFPNEVFNFSNTSTTSHFRADGTHFEQSPGYAGVAINALMKVAYLERAAGTSTIFTAANKTKLATATKALYEFVDQTGSFVATGDTDRGKNDMGQFTLPSMYLDSALSLNYNRPDFNQTIIGWKDNAGVTLADAQAKGIDERPSSTRADGLLPNGGFGTLRKSATNAQLTFDAGPYGGYTATSGHGQNDLLNVELSAFARPLIADPGYGVEDTWAHNTITLVNNSNGKYVNHGTLGFNSTVSGANDAAASSPNYFAANGSVSGSSSIVRGANRGFDTLNGGTVAYRTVYSTKNSNGAYLIMDWVTAPAASNKVEVGFNLARGASAMTVGSRSGYTSGYGDGDGDVWVEPISLSGYNVRTSNRRVGLNKPTTITVRNEVITNNNGLRFSDISSASTLNLAFLTLVVPYNGSAPTLPTISVTSVNTSTGTMVVSLGGTSVTLDRINPSWTGTPPAAASSSKSWTSPPTTLARTAAAPASADADKHERASIAGDVVA